MLHWRNHVLPVAMKKKEAYEKKLEAFRRDLKKLLEKYDAYFYRDDPYCATFVGFKGFTEFEDGEGNSIG